MSVRAILLDAGGTLFTERATRDEIYAQVLATLGLRVPVQRLVALRLAIDADMPEVFDGHGRYTDGWFGEFTRRLLTELDSPLSPERLRADLADVFARPETYEVFAEVPDTLERLGERGLRLAVVSNWSDRLGFILQGLDLLRHFEVLAVSAVVGSTKPDPGLFRWALERLELEPAHALHVGDHPVNDLLGARRAGLKALLVDRSGGRAPSGAICLRSLEELPGLLDSLESPKG